MGRVVTVVAIDPKDDPARRDPAIEEVVKRLKPLHSPPEYVFARAFSVEGLARLLKDDLQMFGAPDIVQIIGHGKPGVLSLGITWTGRFQETVEGPTYLLDSNPYWHGVLDNSVRESTRVLLLGCEVGAVGAASAEVADGPTLIFDLSRMWSCPVSAPAVLVDPAQDFEDGVYKHEGRLVTAHDLRVAFPPDFPEVPASKAGVGAPRVR